MSGFRYKILITINKKIKRKRCKTVFSYTWDSIISLLTVNIDKIDILSLNGLVQYWIKMRKNSGLRFVKSSHYGSSVEHLLLFFCEIQSKSDCWINSLINLNTFLICILRTKTLFQTDNDNVTWWSRTWSYQLFSISVCIRYHAI